MLYLLPGTKTTRLGGFAVDGQLRLRKSEPCPTCGTRAQRDEDAAGCPTVTCPVCRSGSPPQKMAVKGVGGLVPERSWEALGGGTNGAEANPVMLGFMKSVRSFRVTTQSHHRQHAATIMTALLLQDPVPMPSRGRRPAGGQCFGGTEQGCLDGCDCWQRKGRRLA